MDYKLRWSDESVKNLEEILNNINSKWTEKEVNNFKSKLSHQLDLIIQNPYMFPASTIKPELRKAVLSKQTTIFYQIIDEFVYLAYLHINKKDINNIK
ncbi:MAG: type II toxin-antitoxin system RelE/ParE family toxin [Bacteroidales bacterium]|nr:type II toxin-antitoxin system RelE/ParE family toxin [Bacteroidales bacterium]